MVLIFSVLAAVCLALVPLWFQSWASPLWDTPVVIFLFRPQAVSPMKPLSRKAGTHSHYSEGDRHSFPERICIFRLYVKPRTKCRSFLKWKGWSSYWTTGKSVHGKKGIVSCWKFRTPGQLVESHWLRSPKGYFILHAQGCFWNASQKKLECNVNEVNVLCGSWTCHGGCVAVGIKRTKTECNLYHFLAGRPIIGLLKIQSPPLWTDINNTKSRLVLRVRWGGTRIWERE